MARPILGIFAATMLVMSGCYVDDVKDREALGPVHDDPVVVPRSGQLGKDCRARLSKGCVVGHVLSETQFFVHGKEFFNADDLASPARFAELVTMQADGKVLKFDQDFKLQLVTKLGRGSFAQDFEYFLDGEGVRSGKVGKDGNFSIDDLPEGSYDLRVHKSIRFLVAKIVHAETPDDAAGNSPAAPATEAQEAPADQPEASAVEPMQLLPAKQYCATLHADTAIEIRRNQATFEKFSNYEIHAADDDCSAASSGTTLTL